MADEQQGKDKDVTPKGAVEVKEEDLDKAAGGISSYSTPTDSVSLNYTKIQYDLATPKTAPSDPYIAPEKKISLSGCRGGGTRRSMSLPPERYDE